MRQINTDLCIDPTCADNPPGRDVAYTRHHHTVITPATNLGQPLDETHGGPMQACGAAECKKMLVHVDWLSRAGTKPPTEVHPEPQDERVTGVQEDLVKQAADIAGWWVNTAKADAERTVPKAVEYGAADLDFMGQFMVALVKDKFVGADDAELMRVGREMATTFYLVGKIGRMIGAYQQGMLPSDDTLFDTAVYSMMLRRIRETGTWLA